MEFKGTPISTLDVWQKTIFIGQKANYEEFSKFVRNTEAVKLGINTYSFSREGKSLTVIYKEIEQ